MILEKKERKRKWPILNNINYPDIRKVYFLPLFELLSLFYSNYKGESKCQLKIIFNL